MKSKTLRKLSLYNNVKILILITYPIFALFLYFNWNYITSKWFYGLNLIQENPNEFIKWIVTLYYCFFTLYIIFIPIFPLTIFDKKYESTDKISLELLKFNKKNLLKILKQFLIYVSFPLISIIGIFVWLTIDMASSFLGYIIAIIMILNIAFLLLKDKSKSMYNFLKRIMTKKTK